MGCQVGRALSRAHRGYTHGLGTHLFLLQRGDAVTSRGDECDSILSSKVPLGMLGQFLMDEI